MKYIDFHTHTYPDQPDKITAILSCVAPEPLTSFKNGILLSYGIHPWYIEGQDPEKLMAQVKEAAHYNRVVAIGEAGLDKVKGPPIDVQKRLFSQQIEISELVRKPLIIHTVKANNEVLLFHKNFAPKQPWIIHGFSGHPQEMEQFVGAGFYLSFGPRILYQEHKAAESLKQIPADKFLLETDHTNKSILRVYEKAAEIRGISLKKLAFTIENNFNALISIP
ncbi:TatD family hydrolase [Marinilabilia sp.]|uniref:TatD family hydrolase n=1 Tax=Marinilabilia sp. TaxID=2021252 RepID=UPI0025C48584|nr:TatD family hydrolase [Marinilabilia sp.]